MKNKNTFTLRLSDEQLTTLREIAGQEDRTVSAIIRKLIDGIKKNKVRTTPPGNDLQPSVSGFERSDT